MRRPRGGGIEALLVGLALLSATAPGAAQTTEPITPAEHRRPADQTFLTFPEWFLVHSPAEYATFVAGHPPSEFPFLGHVGQFWQSYRAVYAAVRDEYPPNVGYHVMVITIGVSTTAEYVLRSAYETLVGRATALAGADTEEDRFGARVAQDYVDFIRERPWYEYDFTGKLRHLWREVPLWGASLPRKWERRYALTTEYAVKAAYGWLIGLATRAGYEEALPVTAVVIDRLPEGAESRLARLQVLAHLPDGACLALVPRYAAFMSHARVLAESGAGFIEIAGNRSTILLSALVPETWKRPAGAGDILFEQPILTRPGEKRVALVAPVADLSGVLRDLEAQGARLEHVYDY